MTFVVKYKLILVIAILPFVLWASHWAGGVIAMFTIACLSPLLFYKQGQKSAPVATACDPMTGLPTRVHLIEQVQSTLDNLKSGACIGETGVMLIEIDGFKSIEEAHHRETIESVLAACAERIQSAVRGEDLLVRLDGPCFGVALSPTRALRLGAMLRLAARLQSALGKDIVVGTARIRLSASIGFVRSEGLIRPDAESLAQSATTALIEALRNGPGAVRSYSETMKKRIQSRNRLVDAVESAMDKGGIDAHFQPQIDIVTGQLSGFETLARWHDPARGQIPRQNFCQLCSGPV